MTDINVWMMSERIQNGARVSKRLWPIRRVKMGSMALEIEPRPATGVPPPLPSSIYDVPPAFVPPESDATSELVLRARRFCDVHAFGQLVKIHERTALAIAYSIVCDASTAGDVTQEAFLRAWQRIEDLAEPSRFAAWLSRIVRNIAHDHVRRRGAATSFRLVAETEPSSDDPCRTLDRAELRDDVNRALESLDELSRTAVALRYYEGLSSKKIGELLDLSAAAVDMRLSRARAELRTKLAGRAPESNRAAPRQ